MPEIFSASLTAGGLSVGSFLVSTAVSLLLGVAVSAIHMARNRYNKNFVVTLALLPAMVQLVIMMVSGNIGAGIAVAGAFSLVRFRSIPGSARDIGSIFFAMAAGLATGMGYPFYAALFIAMVGAADLLLLASRFGRGRQNLRSLRITIPENLDYDGLFDDIFAEYTDSAELGGIRTSNLGSLFELSYDVRLKARAAPKAFLDALRCRNGNLDISLSRAAQAARDEL
ncbi:MAG: DUF4956 domain-containing protein [Clostridiales Family XIII bacterium]|jgi:hypothetical protein|nr:DUF4956 domain-containing protein [Clostridiales Family XIII bacterium]